MYLYHWTKIQLQNFPQLFYFNWSEHHSYIEKNVPTIVRSSFNFRIWIIKIWIELWHFYFFLFFKKYSWNESNNFGMYKKKKTPMQQWFSSLFCRSGASKSFLKLQMEIHFNRWWLYCSFYISFFYQWFWRLFHWIKTDMSQIRQMKTCIFNLDELALVIWK